MEAMMLMMSAYKVKIGITKIPASTLGTTKKRMGLRPPLTNASTSLLTVMVPISAANAADERPASKMAVIKGPISRTMPSAASGPTKDSAPNCFIPMAAWNDKITPIKKETKPTIGKALIPASTAALTKSPQRTCLILRMDHTKSAVKWPVKVMRPRASSIRFCAAMPVLTIKLLLGMTAGTGNKFEIGSNSFKSGW